MTIGGLFKMRVQDVSSLSSRCKTLIAMCLVIQEVAGVAGHSAANLGTDWLGHGIRRC